MADLTHLRDSAHPDLGRPLDESLVPSDSDRVLSGSQERSPDSISGLEQLGSTYPPGAAESSQGAFAEPADDISSFVVPDRASEAGIPADPLNEGQGRPMK